MKPVSASVILDLKISFHLLVMVQIGNNMPIMNTAVCDTLKQNDILQITFFDISNGCPGKYFKPHHN